MSDRVHKYQGRGLQVTFDAKRCIHSAECVRGLPLVFDITRKPWILPDAAAAETVAEVVLRCPTGALHFESAISGLREETPTENVAVLAKDGPIYLRGDIELLDVAGEVVLADTRLALCRCGASKNKPLCDNSHRQAGFKDAGGINFEKTEDDEPAGHSKIRVQPSPNGPLLLDGDVTIMNSGKTQQASASSPAFCRCGASGAKPYCDGSHNRVNFTDS